eukprot:1735824-Pyramimonas_sp.AAC.1
MSNGRGGIGEPCAALLLACCVFAYECLSRLARCSWMGASIAPTHCQLSTCDTPICEEGLGRGDRAVGRGAIVLQGEEHATGVGSLQA